MKKLLALLVFPLLMAACSDADCPEIMPKQTIEFMVRAMPTDHNAAGAMKLAIKNIDLFLTSDKSNVTLGPFKLNVEEIYASATKETEALGDYVILRGRATCTMPKGDFKMWMWANVSNPAVYSFDKFSVEQKNDVLAGNYMATKPINISVVANNGKIDAGQMRDLTSTIYFSYEEKSTIKPLVLLLSPVSKSVSADGVVGTSTMTLEYNAVGRVLPASVALFGNTAEGLATYEWEEGGTNGSKNESFEPVVAGQMQFINF